MNINEITSKANKVANTWEQYKSINDRRINEIEKKGGADSLTLSHLDKINQSLDKYQDSLDKIESVLNRPGSEMHKSYEVNCEYKNAFLASKYASKVL
jgi:DNA integrity scanning protein DisA with diadenylate cyclase activity